jgi:hypothetical protein
MVVFWLSLPVVALLLPYCTQTSGGNGRGYRYKAVSKVLPTACRGRALSACSFRPYMSFVENHDIAICPKVTYCLRPTPMHHIDMSTNWTRIAIFELTSRAASPVPVHMEACRTRYRSAVYTTWQVLQHCTAVIPFVGSIAVHMYLYATSACRHATGLTRLPVNTLQIHHDKSKRGAIRKHTVSL